MSFAEGAFVYECSGGLLADSDKYTQIPYFLTAAHCINTDESAKSLLAAWSFRTEGCGRTLCRPNGTEPTTLGASLVKKRG